MKNLLLIVLLFCVVQMNCLAQMETGRKYIGGSLSITSNENKTNDVTTTNVNIVPSAGYFLSDMLSAGGSLGYIGNIVKGDNFKNTSNSFVIGPFLREHIGIGDQFSCFIQENLMFSFGSRKTENVGTDVKYSNFGITFSVSPGFIFFPSQKFGIEAGFGSLYFQTQKETNKNTDAETTQNNYGLDFNLNTLSLGFMYYF